MAQARKLENPTLVAVWPGMGSVAINAGAYLVESLGARLANEIPCEELFEVSQVQIEGGLAKPPRSPRCMFFDWKDPSGRRDLLIFVGEAQPARGGYGLCRELLEYAAERGARRFVTFAAIATQLHPSSDPRVFGVATDNDELMELRRHDVEILKDGEIAGLNGVLLAAGAAAGMTGVCLLGEMPFFAARVPNPRATLAVLEVFTALSGLELDLAELREKSHEAEKSLLDLLEQLKEAAREHTGEPEAEETALPDEPAGNRPEAAGAEPPIDEATRNRIEALFVEAQRDRSKAFELKEMLDRHGVFDRYEDRFLDLFRKAE